MAGLPQLGVELLPPEEGWLGIKLRADEQEFSSRASHLGPDFLSALAAALDALAAGWAPTLVVWLGEPERYQLQLAPQGSDLLQVKVEQLGGELPVFLALCEREQAHRALDLALRRLLRTKNAASNWAHPWPRPPRDLDDED